MSKTLDLVFGVKGLATREEIMTHTGMTLDEVNSVLEKGDKKIALAEAKERAKPKKTYFLAWQCDNLRGHTTAETGEDTKPEEALNKMLDAVKEKLGDGIKENLFATQFNNVV